MEYVFVGANKSKDENVDYTFASINQSKNLLISLIDVLNGGSFYPKTFFNKLDKMTNNYRVLTKLKNFIDSGGYSIIVGDVLAQNVSEFIDKYVYCAELGQEVYDAIFSLDIPIFLNQPQFNTKKHIEDFNRESLLKTFAVAYNNPKILDKLYFIWQFKIHDQYEIWDKLYDELNLNQYVKNRALGGMVGLRGITQIDFSPFIGPAYRCLYDYLKGDTSVPFTLHSLGIYIQHDRLFLIILEKLFNRYLEREDSHLTYDSVNYMRTAQLRAKDLPINTFRSGKKIETFQHIETPNDVLKQVYTQDASFYAAKEEIERVKNGLNLKNIDVFTPLNVYSNVQLDNFFEYIVNKYQIVEHILNNPMKLKHTLIQLGSAHPNVFTPNRIRSIRSNFNKLLPFHFWFTKDRKKEGLKELMISFIKDIQFPAHLEDIKVNDIKDPTMSWNKLNHFSQFIGDQNGNNGIDQQS